MSNPVPDLTAAVEHMAALMPEYEGAACLLHAAFGSIVVDVVGDALRISDDDTAMASLVTVNMLNKIFLAPYCATIAKLVFPAEDQKDAMRLATVLMDRMFYAYYEAMRDCNVVCEPPVNQGDLN